jgi:hypothetical protein
VFDNPALLRVNPEYVAWLLSLPLLERERLLGGNWKIRPAAGLYFKREWCAIVDEVPPDLDVVRYWDLAAVVAARRKSISRLLKVVGRLRCQETNRDSRGARSGSPAARPKILRMPLNVEIEHEVGQPAGL